MSERVPVYLGRVRAGAATLRHIDTADHQRHDVLGVRGALVQHLAGRVKSGRERRYSIDR